MQKTIHTKLSKLLQRHLVEMRKGRGWTQRDLAAVVGREVSFVGRIELGERRVDVVEYFLLVRAMGGDPKKTVRKLFVELEAEEGGE